MEYTVSSTPPALAGHAERRLAASYVELPTKLANTVYFRILKPLILFRQVDSTHPPHSLEATNACQEQLNRNKMKATMMSTYTKQEAAALSKKPGEQHCKIKINIVTVARCFSSRQRSLPVAGVVGVAV